MGYSDYDLERPLVGIANSWNRVVPGHYNLQLVAEYVKQGVLQAGGTPVEFGLIAACDGIAQGHVGMHYILPTRELIANDVEMMVQAHQLDAVVLLGSCDKIVPGLLMAAARLDLPAIVVVGGPMEGGCQFDGRASDLTSLTEGLGMLKAGNLDAGGLPPPGRPRGPHLRLLLVPGHGQHDVLRGRGDGHVPARLGDHSGHARRAAAFGPGGGPADRRAGPPRHHRPADHQSPGASRTPSAWARRSADRRTWPCTSRPSPTRPIAGRSRWTCWKSCRAPRRTWPR